MPEEPSAKDETGAELAGPEVRPRPAALGSGLTEAIDALAEGDDLARDFVAAR